MVVEAQYLYRTGSSDSSRDENKQNVQLLLYIQHHWTEEPRRSPRRESQTLHQTSETPDWLTNSSLCVTNWAQEHFWRLWRPNLFPRERSSVAMMSPPLQPPAGGVLCVWRRLYCCCLCYRCRCSCLWLMLPQLHNSWLLAHCCQSSCPNWFDPLTALLPHGGPRARVRVHVCGLKIPTTTVKLAEKNKMRSPVECFQVTDVYLTISFL